MDYAEAVLIGMGGERAVSLRLRQLAGTYDFMVIDDLLLASGPITTQIDHVVIDRHGILVIETKTRPQALLKGKDCDATWTACYPKNGGEKGHRDVFQNPIEQNREHLWILREALRDYPLPVPAEYFTSAVVFVGGRIDTLELDAHWKKNVVRADELDAFFERRRKAPVSRRLDGDEMVRLFSVLMALDHSKEPWTAEDHGRRVAAHHDGTKRGEKTAHAVR
jgi:hypothetical protein